MAIAYKNYKPFLLLLPFFICIIFFSTRTHCMSDAEALLKFKSSLSNTGALDSWDPKTTPCKGKKALWNGAICLDGVVIGLRLKSMNLSGTIDVDALANLPGLRTISLEDNKFTGPMPKLDRLGALKAIYLTNNNFSGPIPQDFFSKLGSLKKLWLSNNSFTGDIPTSLDKLGHLVEVHLDNNEFSGMVPPLKEPPLMSLDLSNNKLKGEIPTSLAPFKGISFGGNVDLCGDVIGKKCTAVVNEDQTPPPPTTEATPMLPPEKTPERVEARSKRRFMGNMAIFVSVILVILSLIIIGMLVSRKRRKDQENIPTTTATGGKKGSKHSNVGDEDSVVDVEPTSSRSSTSKKSSGKGSGKGGAGVAGDLTMLNNEKGTFGMADLMKASAEVLGNGNMGSAYKAIMANGLRVVVKRMREMNRLEKDAFDVEMKKLAILRHKNVLSPLAYHYRKEEILVVYEYVPKGSLHYILHGDRGKSHEELNWSTRLKIIKGMTEGLSYLHSQLKSNDIPHGDDLKSSNILMSLSNDPLLSEYGFGPMTSPSVAGQALFGYRTPEAIQNIKISHKCDVYCLGVVILEILTCKFPSQYLSSTNGGTDVVQWVASAIEDGREADLIDPDIVSNSASSKASMVKMLHIGAACTEPNPDQRPSLSEAKERIDRIEVHDGGGRDSRTIDVLPST